MNHPTRLAARAGALALLAVAATQATASAASYAPASCQGQFSSASTDRAAAAHDAKALVDAGLYPDVPSRASGPGVYASVLAHDPNRAGGCGPSQGGL